MESDRKKTITGKCYSGLWNVKPPRGSLWGFFFFFWTVQVKNWMSQRSSKCPNSKQRDINWRFIYGFKRDGTSECDTHKEGWEDAFKERFWVAWRELEEEQGEAAAGIERVGKILPELLLSLQQDLLEWRWQDKQLWSWVWNSAPRKELCQLEGTLLPILAVLLCIPQLFPSAQSHHTHTHIGLEFPIPSLLPQCQSQRSFTSVFLLNLHTTTKPSPSPYHKHNTSNSFITISQTAHSRTLEFSSRNGLCCSSNRY